MHTEIDGDTRLYFGLREEKWEVVPKSRWYSFQSDNIPLPEWAAATRHFMALIFDDDGRLVDMLPFRVTFDETGNRAADDPPIWTSDEIAVYTSLMQQSIIVDQSDRDMLERLTEKLFLASLPSSKHIKGLLDYSAAVIDYVGARPGLNLTLQRANSA